MRDFPLPIIGTTLTEAYNTLRGVIVDTVGRLLVVAYGHSGAGVATVLPSTPWRPQDGEGQTIAFAGVSVNSAALTVDRAHWVFCEDDTCWLRYGDGTVPAAAGDFPMPVGAVAEYTPREAGVDDVISVIQRGGAGNLLIGQSEE
jgi:hypothetical protein